MSADCISICPACYAKEHGMALNDVTADDLNDESIPNELRENYEFGINCGHVTVAYGAKCHTCNYHIEFGYEHPLPEMSS